MAEEDKAPMTRRLARLRQLGPAILVVVGALGAGGVIFIVSGAYNVAARHEHWSITNWLLIVVRDRSIATAANGISVPNLMDDNLANLGAEHYRGACASCHGVPGQGPGPVYQNMLPAPPDLISTYENYNSKELFWIIYNGLKFTGMPAWPGYGRRDEVWALVAFLDRLRREGADNYTDSEGPKPLPLELEAAGVSTEPLENCVRCHGDVGTPPVSDRVPRLHGQSEAYLKRAIEDYLRGARESGIMEPIAQQMSLEETATLARYYASLLPLGVVASEDPASVARGQQIATDGLPESGVPACVSCHKGDNPQFPNLAGQSAAYLRGQLDVLRKGLRNQSGYGAIMTVVAKRLNDAQIRDVSAFFASRPPELYPDSEAPAL